MQAMLLVVQVVVAAATLLSAGVALFALRSALALHQLADVTPELPDGVRRWPRLSLVIPACNEAGTIAEALRSKLADDYPDLEVVVVDDRSTDGTGDVARSVSAEDERVRVVRVDELPDGWLGKVHALWIGQQAARGEWLLFSDADVRFEPGTMRRAVAMALRDRRDLIALAPAMERTSFVVDAMLAVFMRVIAQFAPPHRVRDPRSVASLGSGSFNLVRREAWERTPGFEWLRMETADDVALGMMMKLSGYRCDAVGGKRTVRVRFQPDLAALFRTMEKNIALDSRGEVAAFVAAMVLAGANEYASLVAVGLGIATGAPWLLALGIAGAALMTAATAAAMWSDEGSLLPAFAWPVGWGMLAFAMTRAAILSYRRGGIVWRGTFYPAADVRAGMRFLSRPARRRLIALAAERDREAESA